MSVPPVHPLLVSVRDAADLLNISRTAMYELLGRGDIPSVRIGASRRVSVADLRDFIESGRCWR